MTFSHSATVPVAADKINIGEWLFTLSDKEYQAASHQHLGLGTCLENGVRSMVNVEAMGGALMVQHYREVQSSASFVEMLSEHTRVYIMHLVPVEIRVRWTLGIKPLNAGESTLTCTVEATMSPFMQLLSMTAALSWFVQRHTVEETHGFAADIARKHGRS